MRSEEEIRQKLKELEEQNNYLSESVGVTTAAFVIMANTDRIRALKWVLGDVEELAGE